MKRKTKSATVDMERKRKKGLEINFSGKEHPLCLFCWKLCSLQEEENEQLVDWKTAGGEVDSVLLRRQLRHWFIIRKLLDVPRYWCENKLMTFASLADDESGEDFEATGCGGPASWFHVCKECLHSIVLQAWQVHDQILKLEEKMREMKEEVRKKIRDSCQSAGLRTGERCTKSHRVAVEIRKLVVADIEESEKKDNSNVVKIEVDDPVEPPLLYPEEMAVAEKPISQNKDSEFPLVSCEEEIFEGLIGLDSELPAEDDSTDTSDDDHSDYNWMPPNVSDDDQVSTTDPLDENEVVDDNDGNELDKTTVVKKMRTRGKDKKKRKSTKGIQRGPRGPYKKKVRDAQKCLRKKPIPKLTVNLPSVTIEGPENATSVNVEVGASPDAAKRKRKRVRKRNGPGKRGKDKTKRKSKPRMDRPKKIVYPCDLCACKPFDTPEELELHKKLHEQRKLAKMNGGLDMSTGSLDCTRCSFPAHDAAELEHHVRYRHEIPEQEALKPKYPCPFCPKKMKDWKDIVHHLKVKHASSAPEEVEKWKDGYLKCDECGFRGAFPRKLTIHKRRHQKQDKVVVLEEVRKCEECGCIFDNERNYHLHVINTHKRVDLFVCDICGAGFPHKGKLTIHKITHTKHLHRDWVCDVCGVDFARKSVLTRHCRDYHPELQVQDDPTLKKSCEEEGSTVGASDADGVNEKLYRCRYCELTSPYNAVIRKHLQTHKQQGEHKCEKCGKFYMNAQGLKRHLRINHNDSGEQFPCPHCNRGFSSKEYMMIHVKRYCKIKELNLTS